MANKTTKRENFVTIIEILDKAGRPELAKVIRHEIELLENKASKKATKIAVNMESDKELVLEALSKFENAVRVGELVQATGYTSQKLTAILKKLLEEDKVAKEVFKGASYYSMVAEPIA